MLCTKLQPMVTCVDGQVCYNFHTMVQCYRQTLHIAVMLHSNFLHLVTLSWTALVEHACEYEFVCDFDF